MFLTYVSLCVSIYLGVYVCTGECIIDVCISIDAYMYVAYAECTFICKYIACIYLCSYMREYACNYLILCINTLTLKEYVCIHVCMPAGRYFLCGCIYRVAN